MTHLDARGDLLTSGSCLETAVSGAAPRAMTIAESNVLRQMPDLVVRSHPHVQYALSHISIVIDHQGSIRIGSRRSIAW